MTLSEVLLYSIARAVLVATLACVPVSFVTPLISRLASPFLRSAASVCALLPLFVPELLIGFTYRLTSARLVESGLATETLYSAILLGRAFAVMIAVRLILPDSAVSNQSLHSWKLLPDRGPKWIIGYCRLMLTGPYRAHVVGWCVAALLCFQEFESAALVQIDRHPVAWSVWLFDAHAAGEPLSTSFKMLAWPLLVELLILAPVFFLIRGSRPMTAVARTDVRPPSIVTSVLGYGCLATALFGFVLWPVCANAQQTLGGIQLLFHQSPILKRSLLQVGSSLGFALAGTVLTMWMAIALHKMSRRFITAVLLLPGLAGSLILSLTLLALFQLPLLNGVYDSPLPMILGLSLLMLPRAFLLVAILSVTDANESRHSANLLLSSNSPGTRRNGYKLLWRMVDMRWLLSGAILLHWSFWDVTVPSILRPLQFEPVVTRLYGEMHYGRTETLTAITLLSLLGPLFALTVSTVVWRLLRRVGR